MIYDKNGSIKINGLPKKLREMALKNREADPEYYNGSGLDKSVVQDAFLWNKSPEGFDFWYEIQYSL